MSHRPHHPPYRLNEDGTVKRNREGEKIRYRKAGMPKKESEYTPEERKSIEFQKRSFEARKTAWASAQLADLVRAAEIVKPV